MSTGGDLNKQAANSGKPDTSGGNSLGSTLKAPLPYGVPAFQGKSGQPDNQSTSRGKGKV